MVKCSLLLFIVNINLELPLDVCKYIEKYKIILIKNLVTHFYKVNDNNTKVIKDLLKSAFN